MSNLEPTPLSGFLLVDKPAGFTSHDVVAKLRGITRIKKIGHAGTLDPFATGLLIVAIGRKTTRDIANYVGMDKTYEATFVIGATTETLDPESDVILDPTFKTSPDLPAGEKEIKRAIASLTGPIEQIPPMYSAIKMGGKKLYDLARKGIEVERKPRAVTIYSFEIIGGPRTHPIIGQPHGAAPTAINVRIRCSSGTYIRALARDLGIALGTTGYVTALRRTSIGNFDVKSATKIEEITTNSWPTLLKKGFDAVENT